MGIKLWLQEKEHSTADKDEACCATTRDRTPVSTGCDREYYIPSVDLLTAQVWQPIQC